MSKYDLEYLRNNMRIGFTGELGDAWWATYGSVADSHFTESVPIDEVRRLIGFVPGRTAIPAKYWDGSGMVYLTHPETGLLLGVNGDTYPETTYTDRLIDGHEAILDGSIEGMIGSCGLIDGGRQAWVQIRPGETITHTSGERFAPWITAYSSYDGSLATTFKEGVTRTQCDNTFEMTQKERGRTYKYKNTQNNRINVLQARTLLDMLQQTSEDMWAELDILTSKKVSEDQWHAITNAVFAPTTESQKAKTRAENKRIAVSELYFNDPRIGAISGTQWGAFQAFSTWKQHETTVNGAEDDMAGEAERNMTWLLSNELRKFDAMVMEKIDMVLV